ncbi:hypothetical protein [Sphingobacterium sp. MYb382]|uniref:hypothetical protein n=1 Tax=Sphingobacterium sp. MYb382 TaxID=2745278 RepID=UPI00309FE385
MEPFEKFQNAVKEAYLLQHQEDKLDYRLMSPSPANLRHYSKERLEQNLTNEDLAVLAAYYGSTNKYEDISLAIKKTDNDKLRKLQNFLNGTTANANEITTKLLAILIDFQPRPFNRKYWTDNFNPESGGEYIDTEISSNHGENSSSEENIEEVISPLPIEEENQDNPTQKTDVEKTEGAKKPERPYFLHKIINWLKEKKHQLFIAAPATLVLSLSSGYFMTKKDCMCWNGEKYVEVNCKDKQHANSVIALDIEKLNSFQKIMREDTLSNKDIGKIWYSKINHEVEFFTNAGHHPVHNNKSLRAATAHIIQNYVLNKANRHVAIDSLQINNNEK